MTAGLCTSQHRSEPFLMLEFLNREETEIIEGEVVEIQIDRPATGTVGCSRLAWLFNLNDTLSTV